MKANKWIAIDKAQDDWETQACKRLWIAVFRQAVMDAHPQYFSQAAHHEVREANQFLLSDYARQILWLIGVNGERHYSIDEKTVLESLHNNYKKDHSEGALEMRRKERAAQKIVRRLSEKDKRRLLVNATGQALRGLELEKTRKL